MKSIRFLAFSFLAVAGISVWCGCGRDVRLAGKKIRHVQPMPVTRYGVTLDQSASPEQVAYVALRAIREDVLAAKRAERDAAIDIQFDVSAPGVIKARNRTSLSEDEYVYRVVTHWGPTVAHYAGDFELESAAAIARLKDRGSTKAASNEAAETELAMDVSDPSGDPAAKVVMLVWLAKDDGLWRITHLGFEPKREPSGKSTTS